MWQVVQAVAGVKGRLAGCGRLWQAVEGCGRLWQAVAGVKDCGWLWQVVQAVTGLPDCLPRCY